MRVLSREHYFPKVKDNQQNKHLQHLHSRIQVIFLDHVQRDAKSVRLFHKLIFLLLYLILGVLQPLEGPDWGHGQVVLLFLRDLVKRDLVDVTRFGRTLEIAIVVRCVRI